MTEFINSLWFRHDTIPSRHDFFRAVCCSSMNFLTLNGSQNLFSIFTGRIELQFARWNNTEKEQLHRACLLHNNSRNFTQERHYRHYHFEHSQNIFATNELLTFRSTSPRMQLPWNSFVYRSSPSCCPYRRLFRPWVSPISLPTSTTKRTKRSTFSSNWWRILITRPNVWRSFPTATTATPTAIDTKRRQSKDRANTGTCPAWMWHNPSHRTTKRSSNDWYHSKTKQRSLPRQSSRLRIYFIT